jgi:hypothetical protein
MSHVPPEPIRPHGAHHPHTAHRSHAAHHPHGVHHPSHAVHPAQHDAPPPGAPRPANVDALVVTIQRDFPAAAIQVTGRRRTVQRQAELMAQRRLQNRSQFLNTYHPAPHISEMDNWVTAHPRATEQEATAAFTEIITRARQNGAVVSNHLSDRARDISIPRGTPQVQHQVRQRIQSLGGHVIDEHDAVGGPHWHVDY